MRSRSGSRTSRRAAVSGSRPGWVRLAQVEGATAEGADRRQGMDQVAKIAAVEKRLQVAGGLSRETPCLLETAHASLAG
jgi:hypothetical protein